ncbi:MAG: type III pantothenate kinase [Cyclobacteriaceae bacterium]
MQVVIDIGNTRTKIGLFDGNNFVRTEFVTDETQVADVISNLRPSSIILSSVGNDMDELREILKEFCPVLKFKNTTPVPIELDYESRDTLGVDRLAGVVGAFTLFPGHACLVIDAGTCITYDVIDADGVYRGGAISPGTAMRFKAMHKFTARLPMKELSENLSLPGKDTGNCMNSGVAYGTAFEMEGMIDYFEKQYRPLKTILCGGDAIFFESKIKRYIFANSDLVLVGLNSILQYNEFDQKVYNH